tara:strand:+ start:65 stop:469 length:405 start_codon:yes stop_codon:yes gene_type:complete
MALTTVNSDGLKDGSIVNADIKSDAAIAKSKLAALNIGASDIVDDTITEAKLDIHAAPSGTDKVLGYTSNGMEWIVAAAGATGGGTDKAFWVNDNSIDSDYTIPDGKNAGTWGPVTIAAGVTVTIGDGEYWTIM